MNKSSFNTKETGWTKDHLLKLISSIKNNIPSKGIGVKYNEGLKHLDWEKVAFPPYSPNECKQKCTSILAKMRKVRSLMEIVTEVEEVISKPNVNHKFHPEMPSKPSPPNTTYYIEHYAALRKKHPNLHGSELLKIAFAKFSSLPPEEKAQYMESYRLAKVEYLKRMKQFWKEYQGEPERQEKRKRRNPPSPYSSNSEDDTDDVSTEPPTKVLAQSCRHMTNSERRKYPTQLKETSDEGNNGKMTSTSQRIKKKKLQEHETPTEDSEDSDYTDCSSDEPNLLDLNEEEEEDLGRNTISKVEDFFFL